MPRLMLAAYLSAWLLCSCTEQPEARFDEQDSLCLSVLDVGQGDALLVSFPGQKHWLVDGGGSSGGGLDVGRKRLLPALRRLGVDHLEKVFMTHAHADHFEGLFAVLDSLTVDELWLPERRDLKPRARALVQLSMRQEVALREAALGAVLLPPVGPARAELLYPLVGWREQLMDSERGLNNGSIVLRVALGEVSFLLTGDIEAAAEQALLVGSMLKRATVLKVPHHASKTSSTAAFVEAVDPLVAVAGIGKDNRFGFPHASVSARYLSRGTPLLWTARHGSLRLCTDGFALSVEQLHERGRPELFRAWTVFDIAGWRDRAGPRPPPHRTLGAAPARHTKTAPESGRARKSSVQSKGPRRSKASKTARGSSKQKVSPLYDDKEWQRRRKKRKRLRAPWK